MQKRWWIKDNAGDEATSSLATALTIDPVLSKLLIQRGIDNFEDARYFFRPHS
jgi:single-stranded-DNA-specific exonuclease